MIPRRVLLAVLFAFLLHGFFILTARYRLSYDAFTHMFFADHYARDWFSLWETRWYTGFSVVSYPPLVHQLIAIFIPILGFDKAYALILWVVTTLFPLGIYTFSRIFTGRNASSYAAITSAILLPIYVTAHIFGQLPFLTATLITLFGMAALAKFLREGGLLNFLLAVSFTATTMAAHHATLMIQPFFIFAITIYQLNKNNWKKLFIRLAAFSLAAIPAGLAVIWPFWKWGLQQQMQTPIDHLSRHNFIAEPFALLIFFWPFYLPIVIVIPFIFRGWKRSFLGLQISFVILFILGLGGTTTLPALLFGKGWEWLTYDRFAFWASLTLLPFLGILFIRFRRFKRMKSRFALKPMPATLRRKLISAFAFILFSGTATLLWFMPLVFPTQPDPIDMQPIVDFMAAEDHSYWRYITFGFGDQFAYLNLLTEKAATLDGSYHTARTIPELRESGIGQIDTAYWAKEGIPAIGPILQASGKYGVRWGFVNLRAFVPELKKNGWEFFKYLPNGIQIWENPDFTFQKPIVPPTDPFESFSWGFFPMFSLFTTLTLGITALRRERGIKLIRNVHAVIIGLLPLSLGFWYYKIIFEFKHEQVYFTYDHALFFISDGLAFLSIILWLVIKVQTNEMPRILPFHKLIFTLCAWITLSATWSMDWRTSLYIAAHFWLISLLILSLQDQPKAWNGALAGTTLALLVQALAGFIEFNSQSTQFLKPLNLHWPGLIDATSKGASILKFANDENFLRVYGLFPHPNILAGFALFGIAAAVGFIFSSKRTSWFIVTPFLMIGTALLAVTFSRSAWLGLAAFFLVLLLKSKLLDRKKIWFAISLSLIVFASVMIPLRELFLSRTTSPTTNIEKSSLVGRTWLNQQALSYAKEKPLTGIGAGSFVIQLAERAGEFNFVEPVHNVPLLILSELGLIGIVILIALVFLIAKSIVNANTPQAIIAGALLTGFGVIALFDHYLWSLAPGRMMLGLALGLWQGQMQAADE
ncbi:O-antigen ligase family protein [Candidatus Villigracilis affinis]|uniref:O-antigen ligase family protein n=1 Tax=Candidatus Villigracilis affinis TaxID=3140682 RepID=UPI001D9ECF61|nr:O-antigen ligase family protein [Anaerolineales bacterium]